MVQSTQFVMCILAANTFSIDGQSVAKKSTFALLQGIQWLSLVSMFVRPKEYTQSFVLQENFKK